MCSLARPAFPFPFHGRAGEPFSRKTKGIGWRDSMGLGETILRLIAKKRRISLPGERPKDPVLRKIWDSMVRRGLDPRSLADWERMEEKSRVLARKAGFDLQGRRLDREK